MRMVKNIFSRLHIFVLWALLSAMLWAWIFTLVTDTAPDKKVTVYCHVPQVKSTELAVRLEEGMPDGLKMIKVHSFDYVMFEIEPINGGDIYIIPASERSEFADDLSGSGVKVYDAETGTGIAAEYITYGNEDYYLFFGAHSVHLEDGKASAVAQALLAMK